MATQQKISLNKQAVIDRIIAKRDAQIAKLEADRKVAEAQYTKKLAAWQKNLRDGLEEYIKDPKGSREYVDKLRYPPALPSYPFENAGSSGWRSFDQFLEGIHSQAQKALDFIEMIEGDTIPYTAASSRSLPPYYSFL